MDELTAVLTAHAKRYPLMEPTDAVKLIYQNEFGGGHLIRNEEACLQYLRSEYATVERNPSMPRSEYIGNGISRIHLAALEEWELEDLGREFIRSAADRTGKLDSFLEKLGILREVTCRGVFSFGTVELDAYLAQYEKMEYPAVSHSERYRRAYRPAYRVVASPE